MTEMRRMAPRLSSKEYPLSSKTVADMGAWVFQMPWRRGLSIVVASSLYA
jgi:hypothetical protein